MKGLPQGVRRHPDIETAWCCRLGIWRQSKLVRSLHGVLRSSILGGSDVESVVGCTRGVGAEVCYMHVSRTGRGEPDTENCQRDWLYRLKGTHCNTIIESLKLKGRNDFLIEENHNVTPCQIDTDDASTSVQCLVFISSCVERKSCLYQSVRNG